jgi:glycosyltransferase involved in cell wall biosynthesis
MHQATTPRITIVIPTHNRSKMLAKTLSALSAQSWTMNDFEVIVVADDCRDETANMVTAYSQQAAYPLHLISHTMRSASASRNRGAAQGSGSTLIFIDDDIIPCAEFIQAHMAAQQPNRVVLGYSKPFFPGKPTWWQAQARLWWEDVFRAMRQPGHRYSYSEFFSGNVSMPLALFRQVGGFDESIKWKREDYELGLRLLKAGAQFHYAPATLGYHCDNTDLQQWLRGVRQEGSGDVMISERHPELRHQLFGNSGYPTQHTRGITYTLRDWAFNNPTRGDWVAGLLLRLATLCEQVHVRGPWWHIREALREYNYWRGVAIALASLSQTMTAWLQEAPTLAPLTQQAVVIDINQLPPDAELQELLTQASTQGLALTHDGCALLAIAPQMGMEPLRKEHVGRLQQDLVARQFIPSLALQWLRAKEGISL